MQAPILSSMRELDGPPRRFLLFIAFNVLSWQCTIGPALVLIARKVDMPPSWVGFLISFTPLSMVLVVLTAPLITRYGPKRVMLNSWTLRNLITCIVFLMPWAIARYGQRAGWYVLLAAILGFCLMRALGAGGWLPWLYEVVPGNQRSAYFSSEAVVTQFLNVLIMLGQGLLLYGHPGLNRYLMIYAVGIVAGLISVTWMYRVPGGEATASRFSWRGTYATYREALRDRQFLAFVGTASMGIAAINWLAATQVLYMRDSLLLSGKTIMYISAAGSIAVVLTVRYWGRFAEYSGSGPCMFLTVTAHSLLVLGFLALYPGAPWALWLICPFIAMTTLFNVAFCVAANRGMMNNLLADHRVGYSNVWTIMTSLAWGIPPIIAGHAIEYLGLWGFRICFILGGIFGLITAVLALTAVKERSYAPRAVFAIKTAGFANTIGRIVTVTIGIDESNRSLLCPPVPPPSAPVSIPGSAK